nr:hypothetical protein [Streptomyces sp. SID4948]
MPRHGGRDGGPPLDGTGLSAILPGVEQRIGSTSPPVPPAGIDPAYIPGLTPLAPAEGLDAVAQPTADIPPEDAVTAPPSAAPSLKKEASGAEETEVAEDSAAPEGAEDDEVGDDEVAEDIEDGLPVFEATDRRGAIIADRSGVTFRLDDQEAEFGWDEIGAVEIDTPRFGRRFSVTVYTSSRRWFQADVDAPSRGTLKQWTAELDAVLDARFEDGGVPQDAAGPGADDDGTEAGAETGAEIPAEAAVEQETGAEAEPDAAVPAQGTAGAAAKGAAAKGAAAKSAAAKADAETKA